MFCRLFLLSFFYPLFIYAQFEIRIESGPVFEGSNQVAVPGDTGTKFNLASLSSSPESYTLTRAHLAYTFNEKHKLRLLWAPLSVSASSRINENIDFADASFTSGQLVDAVYKFNSYRLSYMYYFNMGPNWDSAFGFTAKIRDAKIQLSSTSDSGQITNVGFVPLLHFHLKRNFGLWSLWFDFDGAWAPQGRAYEPSIALERHLTSFGIGHSLSAYAGYRFIEGGADNDTVYNFAFIQSGFIGLKGVF